jgi:UDP-glucose:(heptosyl)LPS alpha-1,3-glucosyltransferase
VNIAFVLFRAEPQRGGAERYAIDLAKRLAARGHRLTIIAKTFGDIDRLDRHPIRCAGVTRWHSYNRFLVAVDTHLKATRYDIVHSFLPINQCDVYHAQAGLEGLALRDGHLLRPTAWSRFVAQATRSLNRKRARFAVVERQLIEKPKSPITIVLSKRERDDALKFFHADPARLVAMYNGIDTARFPLDALAERGRKMRQQFRLADSDPLLVFIGNDFHRKGLDTAIRGLGQMKNTRAQLLVVGSDKPDKYVQIAVKSGAVGRVLFVGATDQVADYLAAADVLVLPTRFEPFGMVVVEAMLMGVPPIVSKAAGASEVVRSGTDGFIVDSINDPQAWCAAIEKTIASRESMSAACLARRAEFDFETHVRDIEAVYARAR